MATRKIFRELKGAFNDIELPYGVQNGMMGNVNQGYFPPPTATVAQLDHVKQFQVGEGTKTFKIDSQGMWLGDKLFTDAPWRIDMNGNMYFNDGEFDRIFIGIGQ